MSVEFSEDMPAEIFRRDRDFRGSPLPPLFDLSGADTDFTKVAACAMFPGQNFAAAAAASLTVGSPVGRFGGSQSRDLLSGSEDFFSTYPSSDSHEDLQAEISSNLIPSRDNSISRSTTGPVCGWGMSPFTFFF